MLEGAFIDISCLLPQGVTATTFAVEILDPNTMQLERIQGRVQSIIS